LAAFALRIYRLDAQSLWGDEGWAIYHAGQDTVSTVLRDTRDAGNNPPLYYLLLHFWMPTAGRSEFAMRYLSFLFGVLAVPAIFALGHRLGGRGVGFLAALLHALSPYHVYYSQELRMYAPMMGFVILSSYFFWRLFTARERWPWMTWGAYALTGALAVYFHAFATPVIAAHGLVWLIAFVGRPRQMRDVALRCLTAQVMLALLFSPWLGYIWDRVGTLTGQVEAMSVSLPAILRRCLHDFSAGVPIIASEPRALAGWVRALFLSLIGLAVLWPWRRRNWMFLVACGGVPILSVYLLSFPPLPGWGRYFSAASPFFHLLVARGAAGVARLVRALAPRSRRRILGVGGTALLVAPLVVAQARSLRRYYTDPAYWRWDYRTQIRRMADDAAHGAAVLVNGKKVPSTLFEYYYPEEQSFFLLPPVCTWDEAQIRRRVAEIADAFDRVWLMRLMPMECDPNQRAAQWLKANAYQVSERWLESNVFDLYLTPEEMTPAPTFSAHGPVTFGERFVLEGVALNARRVTPGGALAVRLEWRALTAVDVDYKFFLVLLGPEERVLAMKDGMPLNWLRPTSTWQAEERVTDRWGLTIDEGTPAGTYPLYVGIYHPADGQRLPVQAPEAVVSNAMLPVAQITIR
jgi:hypothetical protein